MEQPSLNSEQTAKYNESSLQLFRLNNIWTNCQRYQREGNLIKLKWEVMNAWVELSASGAKLDEQKKYYSSDKTKKTTWSEKMIEFQEQLTQIKNREELFKLLFKIQVFLRLLQDRSGKGTKWVDSDEDDIE